MKTTIFRALRVLPSFLVCLAPLPLHAQFDFVTNNGAITITAYTGPGGDVTIPSETNGLPVTTIGGSAFAGCAGLKTILVPNTITNLGRSAFYFCTGLTNAILGNGIRIIEAATFYSCSNLAAIIIPDSVTSVGNSAFAYCTSLTNVVVGSGVRYFRNTAFAGSFRLTFYFRGDAPSLEWNVFDGVYWPTAFYLPGTSNWEAFVGSAYPPVIFDLVPWFLPDPLILTIPPYFGVQTNQFGFRVSWATNATVIVEACTNLVSSTWLPLVTNSVTMNVEPLETDGWFDFSDPDWTNYPTRFYRIRSP